MKRTHYRPLNRDHMKRRDREWGLVVILILVAVALLIGNSAEACEGIYLKVGASYKTHSESSTYHNGVTYQWKDQSSPIGARFELGAQKGNFTTGVAHYSQWGDGWPFNDSAEPSRTEVYIDYKFDLWGL